MDRSLVRTRPAVGWALVGAGMTLFVVAGLVLTFDAPAEGMSTLSELLVVAGVLGFAAVLFAVVPDPATSRPRPAPVIRTDRTESHTGLRQHPGADRVYDWSLRGA